MKVFIIFLLQSSWMPFFYGIYRNKFKCKLCKETITFIMKIFIIFHVPEFMDAFLYGIYRIQFKCKLCKDNNICYENVHHISVPEFKDVFFMVFIEFNLNVNCVKTITLLWKFLSYFCYRVQGCLFYGIYRIQFKCKLCKDNNICYGSFHQISVPEFMDAFFYGISRIQLKCKLCKDNNICYENFHHISVPEFMEAFI